MEIVIQQSDIEKRIFTIRNVQVFLDNDLADFYQVSTSRLNEQVKRNTHRFPADFMFQLTEAETTILMSQNAMSSWGGRRKLQYVFSEQGVAAVSEVLKSDKAAEVSINIYHIGASLKDLGKKWFAFSRMDSLVNELLSKLNH